MSIRHAILGFLSWKPFTGYELKKIFADALSFHWSGNNNQIYGSLVELHASGSVVIEVVQQEKLPAKKLYSITDAGRQELREWLLSEPELPMLRSLAHVRLAWSENVSDAELDAMLSAYERQLADQAIMFRETIRRRNEADDAVAGSGAVAGGSAAGAGSAAAPGRSDRERLIWTSIEENHVAFYENELAWVTSLKKKLAEL